VNRSSAHDTFGVRHRLAVREQAVVSGRGQDGATRDGVVGESREPVLELLQRCGLKEVTVPALRNGGVPDRPRGEHIPLEKHHPSRVVSQCSRRRQPGEARTDDAGGFDRHVRLEPA
jgi:hypothetical protein